MQFLLLSMIHVEKVKEDPVGLNSEEKSFNSNISKYNHYVDNSGLSRSG